MKRMKVIKVFLASSKQYILPPKDKIAQPLQIIVNTLRYIYGNQKASEKKKIKTLISNLINTDEQSEFYKCLSKKTTDLDIGIKGLFKHLQETCARLSLQNWNDECETIRMQLDNLNSYIQSKKDYQVEIDCWWDKFKSEGDFIKSLLNIANNYDIGMFILGKDIKATDGEKESFFPNSNVLIELGMFKGLGKQTYIIKDEAIIWPSDINSLKSVSFSRLFECIRGFVETIDNYLLEINQSTAINSEEYSQARVFYDTVLSNKLISYHDERGRNDFIKLQTKALYIGTKSAYFWEIIENSEEYIGLYITEFLNTYKDKLNRLEIDNVISFGPGVGTIDKRLMNELPYGCRYVPVDINVSLAMKSRQKMRENQIPVPFAIIDDFEDPSCYQRLKTLLNIIAVKEIGHRNLFSMLGVTFSNLSMNCLDFFNGMAKLMDDDDYLLLDVIVYDPDKNKDEDLVTITQKRITDDSYWNLLSNTIIKKYPSLKDNLNQKNLSCSCLKTKNTYTKVDRTLVFEAKYNNNTLLIGKFYCFNELKKYIQKRNFIIKASEEYTDSQRGILLLQKKPSKLPKKAVHD